MSAVKEEIQLQQSSEGRKNNCLSHNVQQALEAYLADLDGHEPSNLYDLFLAQVEKPMFEVVLQYTRGNVTKAAQILGLNRGTLRNRLKKHGLD